MVKKMRIAALVVAVIGAAATMVPAAVIAPGSITLTSPERQEATRGEISVDWVWKPGKLVRSTSTVDFHVTQNGVAWYTIKVKMPIRTGSFSWNTQAWPDGVYAVRATVSSTSVKSVVSPMLIDNTAPEVRISRPAEGEVLVENERTVFFAAVVGTARLEAEARDGLSGVQTVNWYLDDEQIGTGTPYDYNFSMHPGNHVLKAEAIDRAGNAATHEIAIIVIPGPSAADGVVPKPSDIPVPDPTQTPSSLSPSVPTLPSPDLDDIQTPYGGAEQVTVPSPSAPTDAPVAPSQSGTDIPSSVTFTVTVPK